MIRPLDSFGRWRANNNDCFRAAEHGTPCHLKEVIDRGCRYDRSIFEYLVKAGKLDMLKTMGDATECDKYGGDSDSTCFIRKEGVSSDWCSLYRLAITTAFPEIAAYLWSKSRYWNDRGYLGMTVQRGNVPMLEWMLDACVPQECKEEWTSDLCLLACRGDPGTQIETLKFLHSKGIRKMRTECLRHCVTCQLASIGLWIIAEWEPEMGEEAAEDEAELQKQLEAICAQTQSEAAQYEKWKSERRARAPAPRTYSQRPPKRKSERPAPVPENADSDDELPPTLFNVLPPKKPKPADAQNDEPVPPESAPERAITAPNECDVASTVTFPVHMDATTGKKMITVPLGNTSRMVVGNGVVQITID